MQHLFFLGSSPLGAQCSKYLAQYCSRRGKKTPNPMAHAMAYVLTKTTHTRIYYCNTNGKPGCSSKDGLCQSKTYFGQKALRITRGHINQDQTCLVKLHEYIGICGGDWSWLVWPPLVARAAPPRPFLRCRRPPFFSSRLLSPSPLSAVVSAPPLRLPRGGLPPPPRPLAPTLGPGTG